MGRWITKDGKRIYIRGKGTGTVVAAAVGLAVAGGGAGAFGGAAGGGGAAEALPGNAAGDVVDSLPGRSLKTRRAEARESAKRGKADEAWSRLKLKELKRVARHEGDCLAAATDRVRDFLVTTPCTSLDRMLLAVGDGHGNAAVISVVRVGFRSAKQAAAFEKVEAIQGSGDVRPLEIAAVLGVAGVRMTGLHYEPRPDGHAMVVAEADTATGHVGGDTLDALADVAAYLPVR
ncbi:hypothetical protein SAMN05421837_1011217 [Amycolatopsis pretoriensis]|uniref:Uncharacterized protein n=1 Tax=Amycolatopsis pretoriensis TaxID=218821 RepID=A0A1H5Q7G1_9PSEU|nr:hypothetical protein [Amycolatopsis pretoriensis]SEF22053.1 hypothetical protein SAMN05421837_1011217 [Amycolatopsis pretoriensis]